MKPCETCGTEHGEHQAHVFASAFRNQSVTAERNQSVTSKGVTCNQCVTKDAEIVRLRNQLREKLESRFQEDPKRDRAAYMREYRKRTLHAKACL